ncbi:helix-turn-helix domain-containing protein [Lysinibacillus sp. FSL K6-4013]|uniref:helix-turn-helix transcriptional regulator n=1 Tax=Lysinibacillus sp. FSL K6-4013 TaxID=2921504 RepID=UPI00315A8B47
MISNKVKEVRRKRGMSISELARRTNLSRVTIMNVENKEVIPNLETAILISRELDREIGDIFFEVSVNHELQRSEVVK